MGETQANIHTFFLELNKVTENKWQPWLRSLNTEEVQFKLPVKALKINLR